MRIKSPLSRRLVWLWILTKNTLMIASMTTLVPWHSTLCTGSSLKWTHYSLVPSKAAASSCTIAALASNTRPMVLSSSEHISLWASTGRFNRLKTHLEHATSGAWGLFVMLGSAQITFLWPLLTAWRDYQEPCNSAGTVRTILTVMSLSICLNKETLAGLSLTK